MSFLYYIYAVTLGGVTYRGRGSINMNRGPGIPATFEAEAACWLEGLAGGMQREGSQ